MLSLKPVDKFFARLGFSLLVLLFALAACNKTSKATPTPAGLSPDAINTAAAMTAEARRNQASPFTPTSPALPTFDATAIAVTQAAATAQAQITPSPVITATVVPDTPAVSPTLTPPLPVGQDNAVFTGKETIPDGTKYSPGTKFTKSWQLINAGQTTWTTAYSLVFVSGDQMGGPESVPLKIEVGAGRVVDVAVDLQAPEKTGTYKGNWRLRNAAGQVFGDIIYVQIDVTNESGSPDTTPVASNGKVTSVTFSASETSFTGTCPHTINFTAEVKVNRDTDVTFVLEYGGGLSHAASSPETTLLSEGIVELNFSPEFSVTGSGWVRLHVTGPNDISSNKVEISLTCQS
jgi:hypothetical protein